MEICWYFPIDAEIFQCRQQVNPACDKIYFYRKLFVTKQNWSASFFGSSGTTFILFSKFLILILCVNVSFTNNSAQHQIVHHFFSLFVKFCPSVTWQVKSIREHLTGSQQDEKLKDIEYEISNTCRGQ